MLDLNAIAKEKFGEGEDFEFTLHNTVYKLRPISKLNIRKFRKNTKDQEEMGWEMFEDALGKKQLEDLDKKGGLPIDCAQILFEEWQKHSDLGKL